MCYAMATMGACLGARGMQLVAVVLVSHAGLLYGWGGASHGVTGLHELEPSRAPLPCTSVGTLHDGSPEPVAQVCSCMCADTLTAHHTALCTAQTVAEGRLGARAPRSRA